MSRVVDVMLCVNHHANGNYCGRCSGVNIPDFIDLEPRVLPEPRCRFGANWFGIHRKQFSFLSRQSWVGNWCWDSIRVTPMVAAELVATLLAQRIDVELGQPIAVWSIDCAHGDDAISISRRHEKGEPIDAPRVWSALTASMREVGAA